MRWFGFGMLGELLGAGEVGVGLEGWEGLVERRMRMTGEGREGGERKRAFWAFLLVGDIDIFDVYLLVLCIVSMGGLMGEVVFQRYDGSRYSGGMERDREDDYPYFAVTIFSYRVIEEVKKSHTNYLSTSTEKCTSTERGKLRVALVLTAALPNSRMLESSKLL